MNVLAFKVGIRLDIKIKITNLFRWSTAVLLAPSACLAYCFYVTVGCSENAECTNSDGSFSCVCQDGYEGDGQTCNDKDEC